MSDINSTLEAIKSFVSSVGSTRNDILISGHCSGFRVTLIADGKHISFSTGHDFLPTFEDALKYFNDNLEQQKNVERKRLKEQKQELLKEIKKINNQLSIK